jgi:hypothetical protein
MSKRALFSIDKAGVLKHAHVEKQQEILPFMPMIV